MASIIKASDPDRHINNFQLYNSNFWFARPFRDLEGYPQGFTKMKTDTKFLKIITISRNAFPK